MTEKALLFVDGGSNHRRGHDLGEQSSNLIVNTGLRERTVLVGFDIVGGAEINGAGAVASHYNDRSFWF